MLPDHWTLGAGKKYPSGYRDLEDPNLAKRKGAPLTPPLGGSCPGQAIPEAERSFSIGSLIGGVIIPT